MRQFLLSAAFTLAPLVAAGASISAARSLPPALARPWFVLAASSLLATVSVVHLLVSGGSPLDGIYAVLNVAAVASFAVGLGWVLQLRDRQRFFEVALDAGLVIGVAIVATLRWSPALQLATEQPDAVATSMVAVFGAPIAAGCALLFATVLLLVRGKSPAGPLGGLFAAAAIGLAISVMPLGFGRGACCQGGDIASVSFVIGWVALGGAAVHAARRGSRAFRAMGAEAGDSRLRMVVAPLVAILLGAIAVDIAWNGQIRAETVSALAALGMVLALRLTQILFATRRLSAERIELDQSSAMIELSRALSGTNDLQETLDLVASWAVKLMGGRGAGIELLTADGNLLEIRAIHGLSSDMLRMRFAIDGSFTGWVVQNGKPRAAPDPHTDPFMSAVSLRYLGNNPVAAVPLRYRDRTLGALWCTSDYPLDPTELELLGALGDQAAVAIENARLFHEVHQLSLTDPLTGMPNRRQLQKDLHREFAAARRGRRLIVVMFDLNGFKQYNDRYGHLAGDDAIRLFASALSAEMRTMNMAARYGGDEFTAILADSDRAGALVFIQRVRERFPGPNAAPRDHELSVAAGLAEFRPGMTSPDELVAAADAALYEEKQRLRTERETRHHSASA